MSDRSAPRPLRPMTNREVFTPPEGVPIALELAPLGARLGAVVIDLALTWIALIAIVLFVWWIGLLPPSATAAFFALLNFALGIPYFILAELVWGGRTLGKRMVGIRVVSLNGLSLHPHQVIVRNLLKEVEFFAPFRMAIGFSSLSGLMMIVLAVWVFIVGLVLWRSKRKQRLGDMVADTIVIVKPRAALLTDMAIPTASQSKFQFDQAQLDVYGRYELQALESILHDFRQPAADLAHLAKVANTIAKRIGYPATITQADAQEFLTTFYRDQRDWLEKRQLFGEVRENKHHRSKPVDGSTGKR